MASSRSRSSRRPAARAAARASGASRSRRPAHRAAASGGGQQQMVAIASIAGIAVVVIAIYMFTQSGGKPASADGGGGSAPAAKQAGGSGSSGRSAPAHGAGTAGKTPDRPAPAIPDAFFVEGDELFEKARAAWNQAQAVRGDRAEFKRHLDEAWGHFETLWSNMEPYTDWWEEADVGDWALPPAYETLEQRYTKWSKLRQQVHKVKG